MSRWTIRRSSRASGANDRGDHSLASKVRLMIKPNKVLAVSGAFALIAGAYADSLSDAVPPSHYFHFYMGQSKRILGTDEVREGVGFAYGFGRDDPQLRAGHLRAQLVHVVHYMHGYGFMDKKITNSVGYTATARYRLRTTSSMSIYGDIGWGLEFSDRLSPDIDSHLNSTPMLGLGVAFPRPGGELMLGVGWFHASNGGTVKPNHGQNYLFFDFGWRY